jgi:hypothetical protein
MIKTFSVIAGAALLVAGAFVVLPGLSPAVEASTPPRIVKGDRLDRVDCNQQAWPYIAPHCLRDASQNAGRAKTVRLVTTDRR